MTTDPSASSAAMEALAGRLRPGAGVRQRQAVLPEPLRGFHQRLLGAFVTETGPPDASVVGRLAAELELDPQAALAALAAIDLLHTDPATRTVSVASPFSGRPTPYRVELAGGPAVFAMCAIDALGIPQMLDRDAHINSIDPGSGQPITVEVHHGAWRFAPPSTMVLDGRIAAGAPGRTVADCCCPHINFHLDRAAADTYRTGPSRHDRPAVGPGRGRPGGRAGLRWPARLVQPTGGNGMTTTPTSNLITGRRRAIGPLGTTARVLVGGLFVGSVAWGHLDRGFHPSAWLLGLVGFPALVVAGQWLRARRNPTPLQATGPVAHAANVAAFVALYLLEPTSDAALLFYGASMWLAAARGYAGCEVLAVSNWLLRRDDQIGCAVFWPIDQLEQHRTARRA
jgi:hypothetical protein